jgi:hypothetical protein
MPTTKPRRQSKPPQPTPPPPKFRNDIFSVKADVRDGAGWCHVFMTTDRDQAYAKAREIREDRSIGLNRMAKVVHPADWVVQAYLTYGNKIYRG